MLREAEAMGAANGINASAVRGPQPTHPSGLDAAQRCSGPVRGPRAHEPPPSVRLGPICSGAPFLKASRTAAAGAPVGYFV